MFLSCRTLWLTSFIFLFQSEEENNNLQKRISQLDQELDTAQEQLAAANQKLEAAAKASADVSIFIFCV